MSKDLLTRRLRLHLFSAFKSPQCLRQAPSVRRLGTPSHPDRAVTHDFEKRVAQLKAVQHLESTWYPRLSYDVSRLYPRKASLAQQYGHLEADETADSPTLTVAGRIRSVRAAGSKLLFIDIQLPDGSVQAVCKLGRLQELTNVSPEDLRAFARLARKGDVYSISGHPHRTSRGELSILVSELPKLLSPSLHQIPETLDDPETRARLRHVDMLVHPEAMQTLRVRHEVEAGLQEYFNDNDFIKVNTPIVSATAGGAAARPFWTEATELQGEPLTLRVAPELWLKRLIVGGMDRVYEIGPAFRNEGVDATHNPEFSICEFYQAYATLPDLMRSTKDIVASLVGRFAALSGDGLLSALPDWSGSSVGDFNRVEFIPTLEEKLGRRLPSLNSTESAERELLHIFEAEHISVPANPTLPRLLDALAARYIEPLSLECPTFIIHHPACMSPLSKHFDCPKTGQRVAARAEFFINGREYANMYEEENSPFEQRRKFEEQLEHRKVDDEAMELDESYLQALEWGMPPTGGWGCGIDRLVMFFSGRERMADVLPFGSMRHVVGLGKVKKI